MDAYNILRPNSIPQNNKIISIEKHQAVNEVNCIKQSQNTNI